MPSQAMFQEEKLRAVENTQNIQDGDIRNEPIEALLSAQHSILVL